MQSFYTAYGLSIASSRPIPYLSQIQPVADIDVEIEFRDVDDEGSTGAGWDFGHPVSKGPLVGVDVFHKPDRHKVRCFHPAGGFFEFVASARGVDVLVPAAIPKNDAVSFLIGPVLAIVCRMRYRPCLHASVLAVEDRAFALIGDKGAGKSTTAARLNTKGARLVADDIAVLLQKADGQVLVHPGYPHIRLAAETAAMYDHAVAPDNAVYAAGGKYYIAAYSVGAISEFPTGPLPLDRVYLLSNRIEAETNYGIEPIDHASALRELTHNAYGRQVADAKMRQKDFRLFADLARSDTVRATVRPNDLATLDGFCEQLLQDFAS